MIHFCTVCDSKYLHKGLALYQSLKNTVGQENFRLHWLCIDQEIYETLSSLQLPEITLYSLPILETHNPVLLQAKNNPPSNYGDQYSQYCWTLTPFFIDFLLSNNDVGDKLMYVDSDIFFYRSPEEIFDVVGDTAVGIHTHRFSGSFDDTIDTGWYNVGVMVFNNTYAGKNIAHTWAGWLLDPTNPYYKTHGQCGDQHYLTLFLPLFGKDNICVFDEKTHSGSASMIFHKAPWCPEGPEPIIFYHFSHFNYDLIAGTWRDYNNVAKPEWRPSTYPGLQKVYQDYFEVIKECEELRVNARLDQLTNGKQADEKHEERVTAAMYPKISFSIDIIGCIKLDETKPERVKMLIASIRSLAFLKDHCKFMLLMEGASAKLQNWIRKVLSDCGFNFVLFAAGFGGYGRSCNVMLKTCSAPYVMTFLEDHFCVLNDLKTMQDIIDTMKKFQVDLLRTSFHKVEVNSVLHMSESVIFNSGPHGTVYDNDIVAHKQYQNYYSQRYYIGIHFLATREFARKFWDRDLGLRPHAYEFPKFMHGWEHRVMVPAAEILSPIDDEHGEPNSCLLRRPDEKKFIDIY